LSTDNNPYAAPKADVADVGTHASGPLPALWNPNAAASWSLLFSPIFGAFIHMKNWQAMGEPEKAATAKNWVIASLALLVIATILAIMLPRSQGAAALSRFGGFAMLLAWYFSSAKAQVAAVQARYGRDYPRKGWGKPLGLGLALLCGFMLLGAVMGFIVAITAG